VHVANATPSRLHWEVRPVPAFVKVNVAVVLVLGFDGCDVIAGAGGTTDQVYSVAALVVEPLTALTRNV
jgi:hypothetical protein